MSYSFARRLGACSLSGLRRQPARFVFSSQKRHLSGNTIASRSSRSTRFAIAGGVLGASALSLSPFLLSQRHADAEEQDKIRRQSSLGVLVRSYVVYSMCEIPMLVDSAPAILSFASSIPVVKNIAEAFIRITFFDQFVGADTAHEAIPLLKDLRAANMGALFAYSVEVDQSEAMASKGGPKGHGNAHKQMVDEMIRCIDIAADFEDDIVGKDNATGRRTWVAVKMTALVPDANALINFSRHILMNQPRRKTLVPFPGCPHSSDLDVLYKDAPTPGLTADEKASLQGFHQELRRIGQRAQQRGVKLIVDAEYSWYQPAIDAFQLSLMQEFNRLSSDHKVQPLIYGTFQAYLRRTPQYLIQSFADAKAGGYSLGVKLVRGAYHPHEVQASSHRDAGSLSISPEPPVWLTKAETDRTYNECAQYLIRELKKDLETQTKSWGRKSNGPGMGILFGTHNWQSSELILSELVKTGLATKDREKIKIPDEVTERLTMGQLYGMMDALTQHLVDKTVSSAPMVIKYVPYGALSEVMPYLSRRAIENKSVLGEGAAKGERQRAGAEIRKRLFG